MLLGGAFFCDQACADAVDDELRFAAGLIELGFPDFAERVIDDALAEEPARADDAKFVRAEILMSRRKFVEAEAIVKTIPAESDEGKAARLALANYYYSADKIDEAKLLYDDFFQQYPSAPMDEKILRYYRDVAFKFALMLEHIDDIDGAIKNLDRVLSTNPEPEKQRPLREKKGQLLIRLAEEAKGKDREKYFEQIEVTAQDIEFGGQYWVAMGSILRAQVERLRGHPEKALEMMASQKRSFNAINQSFTESGEPLSHSPKAGYHFVRGRVFEDQGMALVPSVSDAASTSEAKQVLAKALNEYARILKTYDGSSYATLATLRKQAVEGVLREKLGAQIRGGAGLASSPQNADELYKPADTLFRKEQYAEAIYEYLKVLNGFPETRATPRVLTNLGKAYTRIDDPLMAKVVFGYMAERFSRSSEAARGCLILASFFLKNGQEDAAYWGYKVFTGRFPDHEKAPQVLYTVAGQEKKTGHAGEAARLYALLTDRYPESTYYLKALQAAGDDAYKIEQYEKALGYFTTHAEAAPPGYGKASSIMLSADCNLRLEAFWSAFKQFRGLAKALDPADKNNAYYTDKEDRDRLETLHMQASFQQAYALANVREPAEKVSLFQSNAVKLYDEFLNGFSTSELAPKALAAKGSVLLQMDRLDEATATFDELATAYPDTVEGKNSLYQLVEAAVKVGKLDVAREAVQKMAANPEAYGVAIFARVGELTLNYNLFDQAVAAYENLLNAAGDPELKERAYFGLGKSYHVNGDCTKAIENFEALLKLNDKTAFFFDASLMVGRSYRDCEQYEQALKALGEVIRLDKDKIRRRRAEFEVAAVREAQGDTRQAYAAYLLLALTPDPSRQPTLVELYQTSILRAIDLGTELEDYVTVPPLVDKFLKFWPDWDDVDRLREQRKKALLNQTEQDALENTF